MCEHSFPKTDYNHSQGVSLADTIDQVLLSPASLALRTLGIKNRWWSLLSLTFLLWNTQASDYLAQNLCPELTRKRFFQNSSVDTSHIKQHMCQVLLRLRSQIQNYINCTQSAALLYDYKLMYRIYKNASFPFLNQFKSPYPPAGLGFVLDFFFFCLIDCVGLFVWILLKLILYQCCKSKKTTQQLILRVLFLVHLALH